jgi:hypothetical protein
MTKRKILLLLAVLVVLFITAWTLVSYLGQPNSQLKDEILLRHGLVMLALTLPSGWLLTALVTLLAQLVGFDLIGVSDALLVSLTCSIAGYLQWFILLPWVWRKWRLRGARRAASVV